MVWGSVTAQYSLPANSSRYGKHESSTAGLHQQDFDYLSELEELKSSTPETYGLVKLLIFVAVDSGPDVAPNQQNTLLAWIDCFNRHDVDGIFVSAKGSSNTYTNSNENKRTHCAPSGDISDFHFSKRETLTQKQWLIWRKTLLGNVGKSAGSKWAVPLIILIAGCNCDGPKGWIFWASNEL